MKSAIILVFIFASVFAMNIVSYEAGLINSNSETPLHNVNNLQIANYTGSGITVSMVSNFIKVINDAYTYSSQQLANAQYIRNKLEGAYIGKFQVLVLSQNSTADQSINTVSSGTAYVTWSKVNTAQPEWSYIIAILSSSSDLRRQIIIGSYQKGEGMTDSLEKVAYNTIARYETGATCSCSTKKVASDLQKFDGQTWNAVCSSPKGANGGFSGIIYQRNGIYLQTNELSNGKCRYLVWVN